jgi:hypothetical protein
MPRRHSRSADLQGQARQFDLFGPPRATTDRVLWRMLPEETRRTATRLLARLIVEHGGQDRGLAQREAADNV